LHEDEEEETHDEPSMSHVLNGQCLLRKQLKFVQSRRAVKLRQLPNHHTYITTITATQSLISQHFRSQKCNYQTQIKLQHLLTQVVAGTY